MEDQTVKNPDKGGVQSVARIFELIEVLAAHPAGASLQRLHSSAHAVRKVTSAAGRPPSIKALHRGIASSTLLKAITGMIPIS